MIKKARNGRMRPFLFENLLTDPLFLCMILVVQFI